MFYFIRSLHETSVEASRFYILVLGYLQDITQSIEYISTTSYKHVSNNHKNLKIECFPSKVKIVFQVELSAISNINEKSFEVVCDFENTSQYQLNYLVPKLIKKPTSVNNFYFEPAKIDYIIKK